jgi:hypothetical protein
MGKIPISTLDELRNILEHSHYHINTHINALEFQILIIGVICAVNLGILALIVFKLFIKGVKNE